MTFYPELDQLNLQELIARFELPPPEGEEYAAAYYLEVAGLIRQKGDAGAAFLLEQLDKADTARLRAILAALTESGRETPLAVAQLYSYLEDERPEIVAEAVDGLRRQGLQEATDRVLSLAEHASPYVRGSVLRFMRQVHPDDALPLLINASKDPHFIVRENAADELGELGKLEALPYLRSLLADPSAEVRQAAQTALDILEAEQVAENRTEDGADFGSKGNVS